jgi:hypothetical protein
MPPNNEIAQAIRDLIEDSNAKHTENVTRAEVTDKKVDEAIRRIDDLHKAFPGGDWEGHRRYHEAIIRKMEDRAQFYKDLRNELAKKGLWALLVMLGIALWAYVKSKLTN